MEMQPAVPVSNDEEAEQLQNSKTKGGDREGLGKKEGRVLVVRTWLQWLSSCRSWVRRRKVEKARW